MTPLRRYSRAEKIRRAAQVQVTSKTFVASFLIFRNEVVEVAPILRRWMSKGQSASHAVDNLRRMGFGIKVLSSQDDSEASNA